MNSKSISPKLTIQNYRHHLDTWKQPHLDQVKKTADIFHEKVLQAQKDFTIAEQKRKCLKNQKADMAETQAFDNDEKGEEIESKIKKRQNPISEDAREKIIFKYWHPNIESSFVDHDQILKNYNDIFNKKQKIKKSKQSQKLQDFRIEEWKMVNEIYCELKKPETVSVPIDNIIEFFEECGLFYYFYNIHPHRLPNMLQDFAKKNQTSLTKDQFFDFFLIDRPNLSEYKFKTQRVIEGICILGEECWRDMKAIFDTLDTFGNESIDMKSWLKKIKKNLSSLQLLSAKVIDFPEINRSYNLQKIIFDLENKYKFNEKMKWQEIQELITNFNHIEEPSLEKIYESKIARGEISKNTNSFLIEQKVVKSLKSIFRQCPKYSHSFVKSSLFALQILQSSSLKNYFSSPARLVNSTKNEYINLESVIKLLTKEAPEYFDMDEMLEYFSIRGPKKRYQSYFEEDNDTSSEEDIKQQRSERKLKKMKSLENLKKNKQLNKNKAKYYETKPKQFNLYKREGPTIRQQKVKEMIKEREMLEEREIKKQFKANSIPAALNPERYQRYVKIMQKKKQVIMNGLTLKRQEDDILLEHLKSNTKLFEPKKKKSHCQWGNDQPFKFEPKPVPYNNSEELLQKIERQKLQRREKIYEQTKNKYEEKYWKNLPITEKQDNNNQSFLEELQWMERKTHRRLKTHEVPDFEYLHQKFYYQLEMKKKEIKPTVIREFNLTSPLSKQEKQILLTRKYHSPPSTHFKSRSPPKFSPPQQEIRLTKKFEDWISFNQARQAEKQIEELEKEKQKEERLIKQKNFAKFMQRNLMNCTDNTTALKRKNAQKLKNFQRYMRNLEKSTEHQLAQIYSRVLQRPFLFEEGHKTNNKSEQESPQKIKVQNISNRKQYEYKPGIFDKQSEQFHPIQSQNLNQSF